MAKARALGYADAVTSLLRSTALCCAAAVALPSVAVAQPSEDSAVAGDAQPQSLADAEALYKKGRTSFETANYLEAIELWTEAYGLVDDAPENAAIKAALIYNIAAAQEKAYGIDTDITHLRQAAVLMETYARSVPSLYGDGPEGTAELEKVEARLAELRTRIEEAEAAMPEPEDPLPEDPAPEPQPQPEPTPDPKAKPLIIAGAVVAGLGLAGVGVMAGGLAMGSAANDLEDDQSIEDRRSQFDRGRTGNTLAYVGGIAGGALLVTGAVLMGIGFKKRSAGTMAFTPYGGRGTAGVQLSGRF